MDSSFVIYLGRQTLEVSLFVAAPILLTCIVVGVVITLFQAVTSIRDMSLTVAPKLVAVGFVTLMFGSWMLGMLLKFTNEIFSYIQTIGR
jgi:flagellar biosynthetic protein FliQ